MNDINKTSDEQRRAHKALASWWAAAGVDVPPVSTAPDPVQKPYGKTYGKSYGKPGAKPSGTVSGKPSGPGKTHAGPATVHNEARIKHARKAAKAAAALDQLKAAMEAFDAGPLKANARNTVFARGEVDAPIMIIGEAPGREEDEQGLPFIGQSGQLLDRILVAAGLQRTYITNAFNWRPPQNRKPTPDELAMSLPFLERHIALQNPKLIILVGASPTQAVLNLNTGITRARGQWHDYVVKNPDGTDSKQTIPALPTFHPAFLLRAPLAKRDVWRDMQSVAARLAEM